MNECTVSRFADDSKVSGIVDSLEDKIQIQNDLYELVKCSKINQIIFNKDNWKSCS